MNTSLAEETVTLPIPPSSLAQWYKPSNERHVWLHTMFKLRRELQAVSAYSDADNQNLTVKWAERLVKDYHKAGEMVPEWKEDLKLIWANKLLEAAKAGDKTQLNNAQRKLENACKGCHKKYRAITAVLYRAPDFSGLKIRDSILDNELDYHDSMHNLSETMNRMVIAVADQQFDLAQQARSQLVKHLQDLSSSCQACHQDDTAHKVILGAEYQQRLMRLDGLLKNNNSKESGKIIGEIAVGVCARCHGIHRTASDLRKLILE